MRSVLLASLLGCFGPARAQMFEAALGAKNGVGAQNWEMQVVDRLQQTNGKYSDLMIQACKKLDMKPVCDNRAYCASDVNSVYIGQTNHLSYRPHRLNNNYMPTGFKSIESKWNGRCSYTANANGNYALCNIPGNSHSWKTPATANSGFVCARSAGFAVVLGAANGVQAATYNLVEAGPLKKTTGSYADLMVEQCAKNGMKPVCGHPDHCKSDARSIYLGQKGYIYNPAAAGFGAKNGVPSRAYDWKVLKLSSRSGSYTANMISQCKKEGMKPVCDHPNYCRNDANAIYIGQTNHISYRPHRLNNNYMPTGFKSVENLFQGRCVYTANANGNYALCNIPGNSHSWRNPSQADVGFVCAKAIVVEGDPDGLEAIKPFIEKKCVYTGSKNGTAICNVPSSSLSWKAAAQANPGFMCGMRGGPVFGAALGARNQVMGRKYTFAITKLTKTTGDYSKLMVSSCGLLGMAPVCDHPEFCKNDADAIYLGQDFHLSFAKHRDNPKLNPKGFDKIASYFAGLCVYAAKQNAGGKTAMCNIPINSHWWNSPAQANPGFVCALPGGTLPFEASLGAAQGVPPTTYSFKIASSSLGGSSYWSFMIETCKTYGMKPICDHPSYCKTDSRAIYIGQTYHIAYPPHRNNNNYMPPGFEQIRHAFTGLCGYTGTANGNYALCNRPANSHSWYVPNQYNPGFVCAKQVRFQAVLGSLGGVPSKPYAFTMEKLNSTSGSYSDRMVEQCKLHGMKPVCGHPDHCKSDSKSVYLGQKANMVDPGKTSLGSKNSVPANTYLFKVVKLASRSGQYSANMRAACKNAGKGFKPVCDHPSYCRNDGTAIYIGQSGHLAYRPHRINNNYSPSGLSKIWSMWNGVCSYTGNARGNYALCNVPANSHAWRYPGQYDPGFVCGKVFVDPEWEKTCSGKTCLGAMNGAKAAAYEFKKVKLQGKSGKYSTLMINECAKNGMKPVCEHPSYCGADANAVYIGQKYHISYRPHRNNNNYFPSGWTTTLRDMWNGLCVYTANANGNSALCNIPINSHSWQKPPQPDPGFICAKVVAVQNSVPAFPKGFELIQKMWNGACNYAGAASNSNKALCNIPLTSVDWKAPTEANPGFICARAGSEIIEATLQAKNGVPARDYRFAVVALSSTSGSYAAQMISTCEGYGMKPVCDHPSRCKTDKRAIYIGQTASLSLPSDRNNPSFVPAGFGVIKDQFAGLCGYSGTVHDGDAMCNVPSNSNSWKSPTAASNNGFMCVRDMGAPLFFRTLESKNNVPKRTYEFKVATLKSKARSYSDEMVEACDQYGMKPVCDHPGYCRSDANSIYLGQSAFLSLPQYLNDPNYNPGGFQSIRNNWNGLCSYTAKAGGTRALCNKPIDGHGWWAPAQLDPGFVCARAVDYKTCQVVVPSGGKLGTCASNKVLAHGATCVTDCADGQKLPVKCWDGTSRVPSGCCAAGTAWNTYSGTACVACSPGETDHDSDPSTPCILCESGRYSVKTGTTGACTACPKGTEGAPGASSKDACVACLAGSYDHDGAQNPNAQISALPNNCYADVTDLGGGAVKQNNRLKTGIRLPMEFTIGFEITPSGTVGSPSSIVHLVDQRNRDDSQYGARIPAIYFKPNGYVLQVFDGRRSNKISNSDMWEHGGCAKRLNLADSSNGGGTGKNSTVKIVLTELSITIFVNNKYACGDTWPSSDRSSFSGASVYLGSPWASSAKANIQGLYLMTSSCKGTSSGTPCVACSGGRFANTSGNVGQCPIVCSAGSYTSTHRQWKQGLHIDAYNHNQGTLKDWEKGLFAEVWNGLKPIISHRALDLAVSFSNADAFIDEIPDFVAKDKFIMRFYGQFNASIAGEYLFTAESTDGSRVYQLQRN